MINQQQINDSVNGVTEITGEIIKLIGQTEDSPVAQKIVALAAQYSTIVTSHASNVIEEMKGMNAQFQQINEMNCKFLKDKGLLQEYIKYASDNYGIIVTESTI